MSEKINATLTIEKFYGGTPYEIDDFIELFKTEDGCKAVNVDEDMLPYYEELAYFDDEFQEQFEHKENVLDLIITRVQDCETDYIYDVYYKRRDDDRL